MAETIWRPEVESPTVFVCRVMDERARCCFVPIKWRISRKLISDKKIGTKTPCLLVHGVAEIGTLWEHEGEGLSGNVLLSSYANVYK